MNVWLLGNLRERSPINFRGSILIIVVIELQLDHLRFVPLSYNAKNSLELSIRYPFLEFMPYKRKVWLIYFKTQKLQIVYWKNNTENPK